ncbi:MAG: hypothetical protein NT162_03075 [Candidatus Woesebacteria bacterium]|nr:hypothetical protein [Candidatus Woesebacteria bacterium]
MERSKVGSQKLVLESPRVVRSAARIAEIDTSGKSLEQIKQAVIDAATQIEFPPTPSGYREVLFPTPFRPLAAAVAKIAIHSLKQE